MKVYLSESIDETAYQLLSTHMEIVTDFEKPEELDAKRRVGKIVVDNVLSACGIEEAK